MLTKRQCESALEFCLKTFGPSSYDTSRPIRLRVNNNIREYGRHYPGTPSTPPTIVINIKMHVSLRELCSTIIHEFVHHLLPTDLDYNRLSTDFDYSNNPHEIVCNLISKEFEEKCENHVLNTQRI